jgi:hypothetical protein
MSAKEEFRTIDCECGEIYNDGLCKRCPWCGKVALNVGQLNLEGD